MVITLMCGTDNRKCCQDTEILDAGLEVVNAQLVHDSVPAQVFQAHLLVALRQKGFMEHTGWETVPGDVGSRAGARVSLGGDVGHTFVTPKGAADKRHGEYPSAPTRLAIFWRLHESGLLPLWRILEANEALRSPFAFGHSENHERPRGVVGELWNDCTEAIVQDMRALIAQSVIEVTNAILQQKRAVVLVLDVTKYLFDIGYRKCYTNFEGKAAVGKAISPSSVRNEFKGEALASKAARKVLDRLCCGPEMFG